MIEILAQIGMALVFGIGIALSVFGGVLLHRTFYYGREFSGILALSAFLLMSLGFTLLAFFALV